MFASVASPITERGVYLKKKKKKTYMIREWFTRLEHILLISAGVWAIIRPKCPGHSNYYCLILVVSSALLQLNCEEI